MIGVTERAKSALKEILTSKVDNPQACFRLQADDQGQIGIIIDIEMPGDKTVEHEGSTLLVAEQQLAESMNHLAIDIDDSSEGSHLIITEKPA